MKSNLCLVIATLLSVGCWREYADDTGENSIQNPQYEMNGLESFLLDKHFGFYSSDQFTPINGTTVNIGFVRNENNGVDLLMNGGCNELSGWVTFDEQATMLIDDMTGIQESCEWDIMSQDEWLMTFFINSPSIEMPGGGYLYLTGEAAKLEFLLVQN